MTPDAVLARLRDYMVGPTRFMNLLSCFELGVIDALRESAVGLTAAELGEALGVSPEAVEQLLHLPVKEGFVEYEEDSGAYRLDALAGVAEADLRRALAFMDMIKVMMLRQMFYLSDSVRTGTVVGLKALYGFDGNMFGAVAGFEDLRESWLRLAQIETAGVYPWYFENIDVPPGARVLDVLGGNGLGAIMMQQLKASPGLHVTTLDRPENEAECLRNYQAHGVAEQCSFIGGDVFEDYPTGFDVVMVKHFLDIFDKDEVLRILQNANRCLEVGGEVVILVPTYPEDIKDPKDYQVDFFPAFILGCAIGHGGAQQISTYRSWLEACGFKVTKVVVKDPADIPPDAIITRAILSATKTA
jgi:ubiquinone/menaquinone biosynthesis C-methylase UbiE